jgi:hypothetical protein
MLEPAFLFPVSFSGQMMYFRYVAVMERGNARLKKSIFFRQSSSIICPFCQQCLRSHFFEKHLRSHLRGPISSVYGRPLCSPSVRPIQLCPLKKKVPVSQKKKSEKCSSISTLKWKTVNERGFRCYSRHRPPPQVIFLVPSPPAAILAPRGGGTSHLHECYIFRHRLMIIVFCKNKFTLFFFTVP